MPELRLPSHRVNMAASSNADTSPELSRPLKIPKTEVPSPESEDLSDSNQYHSGPSTPNRFSPLNVSSGACGRTAPSSSNNYTACRGMSWTPSETNALIAVWGNERLTEAKMQQLEVAGTMFTGKAPGPAMYERVSRALSDLGYERTPSQCRERMKTLRRCYSRVKEHGIGKRKSSYTIEQLEKEMESDGSTLEDFSQEDWCNQVLDSAFQEGDTDTEEIQMPKSKALQVQAELSEQIQKKDMTQTLIRILESVQLKWEHFQTWTEFSRLHLSNKLAVFGIGYNTRWREDVRYYYAEISSQVPLGKRLREYFNPEKPEGKIVLTKVQKMNWKNVYYKFLDITISEARCLELHMEVDWLPVSLSREAGCSMSTSHYLLPGDIPKTYGLYAIGYEVASSGRTSPQSDIQNCSLPQCESANWAQSGEGAGDGDSTRTNVTYCYLGIAEDRTIQQCLLQNFQSSAKHYYFQSEPSSVTHFLQDNCRSSVFNDPVGGRDLARCLPIYIKFIEVDLDFLSAGSLVECLETAIGYSLKYNSNGPI
ncbi:myb/SANT-like DNA-binding domain-containing protein 2 isoform X2 [Syngnathoides biaculeatus]|uniref:myb/SANT-like DNA-binding domain-containing protein 2 isoform X2 n=1 Tax=Syngnathoides biaculeatus TaxID=300417 RepID=UPI002ADE94C2|nr:myb/SANT-like DNA-binding domain-containing protein 2 isoform X2 [Syngnathoides biaculeatus]